MKLGLVDVGGGMRGIYGAGIMDTCLEENITFDCCIGVLAGAANMTSFLSGQRMRSYRYYHEYAFRKEYMGLEHFFKKRSFLNFDYIFGELCAPDGEDPIAWETLLKNPADYLLVASDAESGEPRYFTKADMSLGQYRPLAASCCLPGIDRPVEIDGRSYFDGALSDPVPLEKAFAEGCDRVVLILTKPSDVRRVPGKDLLFAKMIHKEFPKAAEQMALRAERYNAAVDLAMEYQKDGRVLVLAPDDITGVDTLKRDKDALDRLYLKGRKDAEKIAPWLRAW